MHEKAYVGTSQVGRASSGSFAPPGLAPVGVGEAMTSLEEAVSTAEKVFASVYEVMAQTGVLRAVPEAPEFATGGEPTMDAPLVQRIRLQTGSIRRLADRMVQARDCLTP